MSSDATIVVDAGSSCLRVGFAGDSSPSVIMPAVVGALRAEITGGDCHPPSSKLEHCGHYCYGAEVERAHVEVSARWPVDRGHITNSEDLALLLSHALTHPKQLNRTDLSEATICFVDSVTTTASERAKCAEMLLETLGVYQLRLDLDAVLALYTTGRTSGLSVLIGNSLTSAVPIVDGYAVGGTTEVSRMAGRELTEYIGRETGIFTEAQLIAQLATQRRAGVYDSYLSLLPRELAQEVWCHSIS